MDSTSNFQSSRKARSCDLRSEICAAEEIVVLLFRWRGKGYEAAHEDRASAAGRDARRRDDDDRPGRREEGRRREEETETERSDRSRPRSRRGGTVKL